MEKQLARLFFRGFWIAIIICFTAITIMTMVVFESWNKYVQGELKLIVTFLSIGLLVIITIISIVGILPGIRDFSAVRKRNFEKMNGTIIRYRRVQHGGEPPTHSWHPIVRDSTTGKEIELTILNRREKEVRNPLTKKDEIAPEFYGTYNFIYLKNTKLAVIDKQSILKK